MTSLNTIAKKYRNGDSLSNKEIALLRNTLGDVEALLLPFGDIYRAYFSRAVMDFYSLDDACNSRGLDKYVKPTLPLREMKHSTLREVLKAVASGASRSLPKAEYDILTDHISKTIELTKSLGLMYQLVYKHLQTLDVTLREED